MAGSNLQNYPITQLQNPAQSPEHSAQARLHLLIDFAAGLVDRSRNQVLKHLDIARLHRFRVDDDAKHLLAAVHFDFDRAAASRSFDDSLLQLLLQRLVLLLGLRHQILEIESGHKEIGNWAICNFVISSRQAKRGLRQNKRMDPMTKLPDYEITKSILSFLSIVDHGS